MMKKVIVASIITLLVIGSILFVLGWTAPFWPPNFPIWNLPFMKTVFPLITSIIFIALLLYSLLILSRTSPPPTEPYHKTKTE